MDRYEVRCLECGETSIMPASWVDNWVTTHPCLAHRGITRKANYSSVPAP